MKPQLTAERGVGLDTVAAAPGRHHLPGDTRSKLRGRAYYSGAIVACGEQPVLMCIYVCVSTRPFVAPSLPTTLWTLCAPSLES